MPEELTQTSEETTTEPTLEQQADQGKLGLFAPEPQGDTPDGVQRQEKGQEQVEQSPRMSQVLEEISRRDREVHEKTKALKEREAEIAQYRQLKELAKSDPDELLRAYGLDPAEYVYRKYLSDDESKEKQKDEEPPPYVQQLMQEIQALKSEKQEATHKEAYSQSVASLRYAAEQSAEETPLAMRALSHPGGSRLADQMLEAANMRYQQYGQVPTSQELVTHVEPVLLQQALDVIKEVWSVERYRDQIREIIGIKGSAPKSNGQKPRTTTLSSELSGEGSAPRTRPMSFEEREEEFVRLMQKDGWAQDE